jgi:hypothetical protein
MTPSLLGGVTAALLAALWLAGCRRPRPILRSCDTSVVAALNRAQLALVLDRRPAESALAAPAQCLGGATVREPLPGGLADQVMQVRQSPLLFRSARRRMLLRQLSAATSGGDSERLEAMKAVALWPDRALLPLVRRGLRDSQPAVVLQAAVAMEAFRGRPAAAGAAPSEPPLQLRTPLPRNAAPRRVSRTL